MAMSTSLDRVKQPRRTHFRWGVVAVTLGVLMYVGAVFWVSHSEGFHFIEGRIRTSEEIQGRVGAVQKVTLPMFGHFREKAVGSDKWVWMLVDVTGDKGAVTIDTAMQKRNNVWKITESSINGQKINLQ
jgi:hypothetical protein